MKKLEALQWIYIIVLIIMVANFIQDIVSNRYEWLTYFGFSFAIFGLLLYKSFKK